MIKKIEWGETLSHFQLLLKETKAPIGYTLDQTKYSVNIAKVDDHQENAVITQNVTAKEQVIRFGFDFSNSRILLMVQLAVVSMI